MRALIMAAAALPLLAGAAFGQGYRSYDGTYRPYDPSMEAREQAETDQLNTGEIRDQRRLDRLENRWDRQYDEAYRRWQREYQDAQRHNARAREWNQYERFRY